MIEYASDLKHVWKIENFSKCLYSEILTSEAFNCGQHKWKTFLYPTGSGRGSTGSHLSIYLLLADSETVTPGSQIYTSFTICIMDRLGKKGHKSFKTNHRFTASSKTYGWPTFLSLTDFNQHWLFSE